MTYKTLLKNTLYCVYSAKVSHPAFQPCVSFVCRWVSLLKGPVKSFEVSCCLCIWSRHFKALCLPQLNHQQSFAKGPGFVFLFVFFFLPLWIWLSIKLEGAYENPQPKLKVVIGRRLIKDLTGARYFVISFNFQNHTTRCHYHPHFAGKETGGTESLSFLSEV